VQTLHESGIPSARSLLQNYPNPFNPATVIRYQVPASGDVYLAVYDLLGRRVTTLVNERKAPGTYEVQFDAMDLGSGIYLCRLTAAGGNDTRRMLLIK
jgi:hypothetical protein